MSSRKQTQALSALFWVVIASVVGVYAYWDHKTTKQKKIAKEKAKLLFKLAVEMPKHDHSKHKGHKHDHKKDKATEKKLKMAGITALSLYNENEKKGKRSIELVRKGPKAWLITRPIRTPGDNSTIDTILSEIATGKHSRIVVPNKDTKWSETAKEKNKLLQKYGLLKPKHRITFTFRKLTHTIVIGKKDKFTGNYFAHVDGSKRIVLVDSAMFYASDKKLFSLRRKELFTQNTNMIEQISVVRKKDQLVFKRHGGQAPALKSKKHDHGHGHHHGHSHGKKKRSGPTKEWLMTLPLPSQTDSTQVNSMVAMLKGLRAEAFPSEDSKKDGKKYGLDKPDITVEVTLSNKTSLTLHFSEQGKGKKKSYYAAASTGGPVAKIGKHIITSLTRDSFEFRRKRILKFKYTGVRMIKIADAQGKSFQLMRIEDKTKNWRVLDPSPKNAKKSAVEKLLNALRDLKTTRYVQEKLQTADLAKYGLDKPTHTFTLYSTSSKKVLDVLYVGAKKGDKYLVTNAKKEKLYEIKGSDYKGMNKASWQFLPKGKPPKRAKAAPRKKAPAKAPAKRAPAKAPAKRAPAKRAPAKKAAKKAPAKAPAKKAPAKREPAKREPAKRAPAKAPAKKAPAKREPAKKAPAPRKAEPRKAAPRKAAPARPAPAVRKAPAPARKAAPAPRKAAPAKAPAKREPAKREPAKREPAKRAPADRKAEPRKEPAKR